MSHSSLLRRTLAWGFGGLLALFLLLVGAQPASADPVEHVFARGDAVFHGSTGDTPLRQRITGMDRTPSGNGYWLASGGRVFTFGDAAFHGDFQWQTYYPIVDMA